MIVDVYIFNLGYNFVDVYAFSLYFCFCYQICHRVVNLLERGTLNLEMNKHISARANHTFPADNS